MEKNEIIEMAQKYVGEVYFDKQAEKWMKIGEINEYGVEWHLSNFKDPYGRDLEDLLNTDERQALLDLGVLHAFDHKRKYRIVLQEQGSGVSKTYTVKSTSAKWATDKAIDIMYKGNTTLMPRNDHCYDVYDEHDGLMGRVNFYVFCQF